MCGIIGILGQAPVADRLLTALGRLEYRGYDSAGVATIAAGAIERRRAKGKLSALQALLADTPLAGTSGIGHTRWATHGAPTLANAHPHSVGGVAVVHNGIIENFRTLRDELSRGGAVFESETDTEVIAHLLAAEHARHGEPERAVATVLARLRGAFALAILFADAPDRLFGARRGSPLVVGYGDGEMYLGSDAIALTDLTPRIAYLEEGDRVELSAAGARIHDENDRAVERAIVTVSASPGLLEKGNYRHYMQKEIFEQPTVVAQALGRYVNPLEGRVELPALPFDLASLPHISIIACGTSFYAGWVASYWLERIARVPVTVDIASEYRYRDPILVTGGLALFISQSGETADTLAALQHCKAGGQHIAVIVNNTDSSMAREADLVLPMVAGPEIGVASTKAFTCALAVLGAVTIAVARARGAISDAQQGMLCQALNEVPARMAEVLHHDEAIRQLALEVARARDVLYLGRGADYPIALEGALKLKEISYIHAEGYAAGEMKHGPIALIDDHVPIIVIAPSGRLFDKTVSNMQEVIARGGRVIFLSDNDGANAEGDQAVAVIKIPKVHEIAAPLLYAIPVQLLAYHVAVHKGTDVDQPRNLAKSVTVE